MFPTHAVCVCLLLSLGLAGCAEEASVDASHDGVSADGGHGPVPDAGVRLDGGPITPDGSANGGDAARPQDDAAAADAGRGTDDAGAEDAGRADAGGEDAGNEDAGSDASLPVPCIVPDTETCNGADDDCDGLVDEGLLEMELAQSQHAAMPSGQALAAEQRAFADLLPAPRGQAFWVTKPLAPADGASPLSVTTLGADDVPVRATQQLLPRSRNFIAASDGNMLGVLWRETDADGDTSVDDLAQSSTYVTLFEQSPGGVLVERDTFDLGGPAHLAEIALQHTSSGELRIVVSYAPWTIGMGAANFEDMTLQIFRYDAVGGLESVATSSLGEDARLTVHAVKRPCGEGWLIGYWDQAGTAAGRKVFVRPLSLDGVIDMSEAGAAFLIMGHRLHGLASSDECENDTAPVLMLATDLSDDLTAYELAFSPATGALVQRGQAVVASEFAFSHIARYGGEWYVTLRNFNTTPTGVFELNLLATPPRVRDIRTPIDQGAVANLYPIADIDMYYIPTHGVVPVSRGLLVTFSNARPADSGLGTDTVAVSHRLGCPTP